MANHIEDTIAEAQKLALDHEAVLVGFSGGKDSLATLDIACRFFKKVYPYYYCFVPGLKVELEQIEIAKTLFKRDVLMFPDPSALLCMQDGLYCDESAALQEVEIPEYRTMFNMLKSMTGATLILTGEKLSDGAFRRRKIAAQKNKNKDVWHPLKTWLRFEVYSYLKARKIPYPENTEGDHMNVCLMPKVIRWLHDYHPDDYVTMRRYFPYIETVIKQREFFGVEL